MVDGVEDPRDEMPDEWPELSSAQTAFLGGFARVIGQPDVDLSDLAGMRFVSGEFVVEILPAEREDVFLCSIQILVVELDEPEIDAPRLLFLHQLNHAAIGTHGWIASIGDEDLLTLTAVWEIGHLDPEAAAAALADGLNRAQEFSEGWRGMTHELLRSDLRDVATRESVRVSDFQNPDTLV